MLIKHLIKKKNRRSQTEIMGLMIIFIILSLIIVFVITSVFLKPQSTSLDEFNRQQLSSSIISAFLKTNSYCLPDTDMKELIISTAKDISLTCNLKLLPEGNTCKNILDSKEYLTCAFDEVLKNSLGVFNLAYQLKVKTGDNLPIILLESSDKNVLEASKSGNVEPYVLPISGSSSNTVEIWLCVNSLCPNI